MQRNEEFSFHSAQITILSTILAIWAIAQLGIKYELESTFLYNKLLKISFWFPGVVISLHGNNLSKILSYNQFSRVWCFCYFPISLSTASWIPNKIHLYRSSIRVRKFTLM